MIVRTQALKQPRSAGPHCAERGQSSLEFILVFPLLVVLFAFIAVQAWWWWNQTSAASDMPRPVIRNSLRPGLTTWVGETACRKTPLKGVRD